jgi:hypothetical protein
VRPALLALFFLLASTVAGAGTTCTFESAGTTLRLTGDCTTDTTLLIPDGVTLDGRGFSITAVDPPNGHFTGAIVMNAGGTASIVDTRITARALADVCDSGPNRFRGIFFDGAVGTIRGNTVIDVNQGASRCQEGNAVEVRSVDSSGPISVEIDHNVIERFQKTGIVVTGDVDAWVHENQVGASANQDQVAANGIQVGYGAWALLTGNTIAGNSWRGARGDVATALLLFRAAPGTVVRGNTIGGNSDIGIYILADETTVEGNQVVDDGVDQAGGFDIGIADYGTGNRVDGNDVRGFRIPYDSLQASSKSQVASAK